MVVTQNRPPGRDAPDEELIDTLIAVSVVARRLAGKLRKQMEKEKARGRAENSSGRHVYRYFILDHK